MMTNLMTISVKKASISSKPTTVYLSCPPLCGLFSIQQNANGGLSYKVKKNPACRILRLRRVALATFFHSAAVRSLAERFLCHRAKFPMTLKRYDLSIQAIPLINFYRTIILFHPFFHPLFYSFLLLLIPNRVFLRWIFFQVKKHSWIPPLRR